jgi:hypothetical protein
MRSFDLKTIRERMVFCAQDDKQRSLAMWTLSLSTPQKAGVVLYGVLIGALMIPATAIGCALLGAVVLLFVPTNRDAGGAFFLAECLLWGLYLGVPVGAYVCWKICRSRLREAQPEQTS